MRTSPSYGRWVLVTIPLLLGVRAAAVEKTWTGSENTNWHDDLNWNPNGTPSGNDQVTIPNVENDPIIGITAAYAEALSVTLNAGATLRLNPYLNGLSQLRISGVSGLSIGVNADLLVSRGCVLKLDAGGDFSHHGRIESIDSALQAPAQMIINHTLVIPASPGGQVPGAIVGSTTSGAPGELVGGSNDDYGGDMDQEDLLVLGYNHSIEGRLNIRVGLVNNGVVAANADGRITLSCAPKSGSGVWWLNHDRAELVVDVPVTGTECSQLRLDYGTLYVNSHWFSCGDVKLSGGVIEVAPRIIFEMGQCSSAGECSGCPAK